MLRCDVLHNTTRLRRDRLPRMVVEEVNEAIFDGSETGRVMETFMQTMISVRIILQSLY